MLFSEVAQALAEIEATPSRLEMTRLLADLLKKVTPSEASIICNISLGQLNPPHVGTQFNIAEKTMISVIADLLKESEAIIKSRAKKLGDLGLVAKEIAWRAKDSLSVHQVYKALHAIEQVSGVGSVEEKSDLLLNVLKSVDQLSAKYIVRIIIGKLRLGFSDMTVVDALSWMEVGDKSLRGIIEDAYNVCADIGFIASVLKEEGIKAIEKMHAQVGIPIRPAAAERLPTAKAIIEKIGTSIAQPKLDGFRLQIHVNKTKQKPKIHFFSRNLQDMSHMFPDLTKAVAELDVEELICEGEAIVYDPNTGSFLPFQETVKRKRKHGIEEAMAEFPLRVFIFDLLYLNGKELLDLTHEERRKKLLRLFKNGKEDTIQVIEEKEV